MTTTTPPIVLPRPKQLLEDGIAQDLHPGAQVYASINEDPVADFAIGEARPGVPMQTNTLNLWLSSSKPVTAIAIAPETADSAGGVAKQDHSPGRQRPKDEGGREKLRNKRCRGTCACPHSGGGLSQGRSPQRN